MSVRPAAPTPASRRQPDPPPEPAPAAREGREANGRFAKNNRGGPGNPFARQTAALRKRLLESVTEQDMQDICTMLILRAKGGSVPHLKLLFSYIIGKPGDAVNPDTLDLQEMEQYRQELGMEELACKVGRSLTPEVACATVQAVRPIVVGRICDALADQLMEGMPSEDLQPAGETGTEPEESGAPSPNGEIGADDEGEEPAGEAEAGDGAPSPIGVDGGQEEDAPASGPEEAPMANGSKRGVSAAHRGHAGHEPRRSGRTGSADPTTARAQGAPGEPGGGGEPRRSPGVGRG